MFEYCKNLLKQCEKKFPETFNFYDESDIRKCSSIFGLRYKEYMFYPNLYNFNKKIVYKVKNDKPLNNIFKKSRENEESCNDEMKTVLDNNIVNCNNTLNLNTYPNKYKEGEEKIQRKENFIQIKQDLRYKFMSLYNLDEYNNKPIENNDKEKVRADIHSKENLYNKRTSTNSDVSDFYDNDYEFYDVNEKETDGSKFPIFNNETISDPINIMPFDLYRNNLAYHYYNSKKNNYLINNKPINQSFIRHRPYENYNFFENRSINYIRQNIISNDLVVEKETKSISYNCVKTDCKRTFTSKGGLRYHEDTYHNEENLNITRPFVCHIEDCQKRFKCKPGIRNHYHSKHGLDISYREIEENLNK